MNMPKHIAITARGTFMGWCPSSIPSTAAAPLSRR
jgi:hypothetical protein